jgi:hypothetical protein
MSDTAPTSGRSTADRRAGGLALLVGAVLTVALIETGALAYHWLPALTGATYLTAAAAGRSRGTLWGPGFVVLGAGLVIGLWYGDGRPADSFQLLSLLVMGLGLGGVLAALLAQARHLSVSAMSVAMPVLLVGAFFLLEQQAPGPFGGEAWPYAVLLAAWGAYELRPGSRGWPGSRGR